VAGAEQSRFETGHFQRGEVGPQARWNHQWRVREEDPATCPAVLRSASRIGPECPAIRRSSKNRQLEGVFEAVPEWLGHALPRMA